MGIALNMMGIAGFVATWVCLAMMCHYEFSPKIRPGYRLMFLMGAAFCAWMTFACFSAVEKYDAKPTTQPAEVTMATE